jgi:hypothetical protein
MMMIRSQPRSPRRRTMTRKKLLQNAAVAAVK